MAFTIRSAEGKIVAIETDYGNAEEYLMFLNEVAVIEDADPYVLSETTDADRVELEMMETQ